MSLAIAGGHARLRKPSTRVSWPGSLFEPHGAEHGEDYWNRKNLSHDQRLLCSGARLRKPRKRRPSSVTRRVTLDGRLLAKSIGTLAKWTRGTTRFTKQDKNWVSRKAVGRNKGAGGVGVTGSTQDSGPLDRTMRSSGHNSV